MDTYDYRESVKNDVLEYIDNEITLSDWAGRRDELEEYLNETLWVTDSVTGNASGSYTFSRYKAEENLCHNMELLYDAVEEFGGEYGKALESGAEYCDVTIRCYLLSESISAVLDELQENGKLEE